jgi:hypothetical protein
MTVSHYDNLRFEVSSDDEYVVLVRFGIYCSPDAAELLADRLHHHAELARCRQQEKLRSEHEQRDREGQGQEQGQGQE